MFAYRINKDEIVIAEDMQHACAIAASLEIESMEQLPDRIVMSGMLCEPEIKTISVVAGVFGIKRSDVTGSTRCRVASNARHVACYILRKKFGFSLQEVAVMVGRKDHTTSRH